MSYYLYDANGYLADLASNGGLDALSNVIRQHPEAIALNLLFQQGYTAALEEVAEEIAALEADEQITETERFTETERYTLGGLRASVLKADEIAIIRQ